MDGSIFDRGQDNQDRWGGCVKVGPDDATLLLGTLSPWSIVPRCPRALQVIPTMSYSWDCDTGYLEAIRHCWKHLQRPGTAWNNALWGHSHF